MEYKLNSINFTLKSSKSPSANAGDEIASNKIDSYKEYCLQKLNRQKTVEFDLNQNNNSNEQMTNINENFMNLPQSTSKVGQNLASPSQSNRFKNLSKTMKNVVSFTATNTPVTTPLQIRKNAESQVHF